MPNRAKIEDAWPSLLLMYFIVRNSISIVGTLATASISRIVFILYKIMYLIFGAYGIASQERLTVHNTLFFTRLCTYFGTYLELCLIQCRWNLIASILFMYTQLLG